MAVAVAGLLHQAGHKVRLHLVGCRPVLPAEATGPDGFVTVYGMLDQGDPEQNAQLKSLFLRSHFLIVPTIAECFGAHWLAIVFPPKPVSAAEQRGQYLLKYLCYCLRQAEGEISSWRESDILAQAANFGWSRAEMKAALMWVCGNSFAWVQTRTESSRRVIKVELNLNHPLFQPVNRIDIPKYR